MTKHESMWSVSELELAGILYALESNSQYFIGRKFKIYADHISNIWVQNLKHSQGRLYRWSLRLQNYQFQIEHVSGSRMTADFLSRAVTTKDDKAADLEDDSALVFTLNSPDNQYTPFQPTVYRPLGGRRTSIITRQHRVQTLDVHRTPQSRAPTQQVPDTDLPASSTLRLVDDSLQSKLD